MSLLQDAAGVAKEVVAHLQCQVCERAMQEVRTYAKENSITDEDSLTDLVDGMCSVKKKEGRWVTMLDVVREDSDVLAVSKQPDMGVCRSECTAVQRACTTSIQGKEDDLVSMLKKTEGVGKLRKKICAKACKKKLPPLPKSWKDEAFEARDAKEVETEDMMAKMKEETGMGMSMYKREDLLKMSEGDMETMAAREAFSSERAASRMAEKEL